MAVVAMLRIWRPMTINTTSRRTLMSLKPTHSFPKGPCTHKGFF